MLILILIDIEHLQNVPFSFRKVGMFKITPRHISTIHKYSSAAKFPVTLLHWKGQISILLTSSYDREKFAMFPTAWVATTCGKHCFHDYICVTLILVLWDLSILFLVDYLWPFIIYIYIYTYIYIYIYIYIWIFDRSCPSLESFDGKIFRQRNCWKNLFFRSWCCKNWIWDNQVKYDQVKKGKLIIFLDFLVVLAYLAL